MGPLVLKYFNSLLPNTIALLVLDTRYMKMNKIGSQFPSSRSSRGKKYKHDYNVVIVVTADGVQCTMPWE